MHRNEPTFAPGRRAHQFPDANDNATAVYRPAHRDLTYRAQRGFEALLSRAIGEQNQGLCAGLVDAQGNLAGFGMVPFSTCGVGSLVVGRHSQVDVRGANAEFALRHVVLVSLANSPGGVRVFDLRVGCATFTGASIDAALAALPAVIVVGPYLLVVLSTPVVGNHTADHLVSIARFGSHIPLTSTDERSEWAFRLDDADGAEEPCDAISFLERETPANCMQLGNLRSTLDFTRQHRVSSTRTYTFRPSASALTKGVLVGRYERCDAPADSRLWSETMSRVHALIFSTPEGTYLCDTGSHVFHERLGSVSIKRIEHGDVFWLGDCRLSVESCV